MSLATEKTADTFLGVVAGTPLNCDWPLYSEEDVEVIYGNESLKAVYPADFTVAISPPDFNTFTVTPTAALLTKINDLIAADTEGVEVNYVTVRRIVNYLTSVTEESVRRVSFLSREIERIWMALQQGKERADRVLSLADKNIGGAGGITLTEPQADKCLAWDGTATKLVNGPSIDQVATAQLNAAAAAASAAAAAAARDTILGLNLAPINNPNFTGRVIINAGVEGQSAFQALTLGVAGGNPVTTGNTDANQIGCFSASGGAQIRFVAYNSGAIGILATNITDYSFNYPLILNPNGGKVWCPSVYGNTTATASNVTIGATGELFRSTSSRKYKHDITDYTRGLADVLKLRPVFYKGNNDGDTQYAGLIAEEVAEAGLTEFVLYSPYQAEERDEDGNITVPEMFPAPDALAYSNMVVLPIKAVQELAQMFEGLKARIEVLEAKP